MYNIHKKSCSKRNNGERLKNMSSSIFIPIHNVNELSEKLGLIDGIWQAATFQIH